MVRLYSLISQLEVHLLCVAVDYVFKHSLNTLIIVTNDLPAYFLNHNPQVIMVSLWTAEITAKVFVMLLSTYRCPVFLQHTLLRTMCYRKAFYPCFNIITILFGISFHQRILVVARCRGLVGKLYSLVRFIPYALPLHPSFTMDSSVLITVANRFPA